MTINDRLTMPHECFDGCFNPNIEPNSITYWRPLPSDLRESGNLEQDATAVMFVYRDEEYNDNTKEPGIAEINVAINRNGTKGIQKYYMDFPHMRLSNLDHRN
jgi:replicative DNA helicase